MDTKGPVTETTFPRLIAAHVQGRATSARFRQQQFHKLRKAIVDQKDELIAALIADNGFTAVEGLFEYSLSLRELRKAYETIDFAVELAASRAVENGSLRSQTRCGVGIVYIQLERTESSLYSVMSPLCASLAAGNCVVIEMPQTLRLLNASLRKILPQALDNDTFAIADRRTADAFVQHCVIVDQAIRAKSPDLISPKTVGSCWISPSLAFVDKSADVKLAVAQILQISYCFSGKSAYVPTAVFVHEAVQTEFVSNLLQRARSLPCFKQETTDKAKALQLSELSPGGETLLMSRKHSIVFFKDGMADLRHVSTEEPAILTDEAPSEGRELPFTLRLYSTRSTDDMLDSAAALTSSHFNTPAAAFVFAGRSEASYLTDQLRADVTCINSIPVELSIGTRYPRSIQQCVYNHGADLLPPRYTREMFEVVKPVVQKPASISMPSADHFLNQNSAAQDAISVWAETVAKPLKPTGQSDGNHGDFFLRSIGIGALAVVLSAASLVVAAQSMMSVALGRG